MGPPLLYSFFFVVEDFDIFVVYTSSVLRKFYVFYGLGQGFEPANQRLDILLTGVIPPPSGAAIIPHFRSRC